MPYVPKDRRQELDNDAFMWTTGDLNYCITKVVADYIAHHGVSYKVINDVVGALEGAKLEFYRRIAAPYEDTKIEQNGDVY